MTNWDCCRTCMCTQSLNPIFSSSGQNEKYKFAVFSAFGIEIEPNDNMPQTMCTVCVNFVNESKKFRKKAEEAQKELLNRLQDVKFIEIKVETTNLELSPPPVEVYDNLDIRNEDYDDEDNITLDNFQYKCNVEKVEEEVKEKTQIEFECKVKDIVDKPANIVFDSKKKNNVTKGKTVKRKPRKKDKENGTGDKSGKEKKERVREQIKCEHCDKILTSKFSLRNHYKIHTGFDFVCEHCGKKFITNRLLLMHCRAKHGYEKTDKCSYCDYKGSNAEQVKIHERLHTGEKPYVCKECGAGFHRNSSYRTHVATHLPDKTVLCDQCPARFKSVALMQIHAHRHRPSAYYYRCSVCGNHFARRRNVTRHLVRVHALAPDLASVERVKRK